MNEVQAIATNQCYLSEVDENGKPMIDPAYYQNIILDNIDTYMQETNTERSKMDGNDLLTVFRQTHATLFKPTRKTFPQTKCNIPYSTNNILSLLEIYKTITGMFKAPPSLYGFSILTGIDEDTVKRYLTPEQYEMVKIRREMLGNKLFNDRMGALALANNDASYGYEWEKKNTLERETIRQGLAVGELPQF